MKTRILCRMGFIFEHLFTAPGVAGIIAKILRNAVILYPMTPKVTLIQVDAAPFPVEIDTLPVVEWDPKHS